MLAEIRKKQLKKIWEESQGVVGWVNDEVVMFDVEDEDVEDVANAIQNMLEFLFMKKKSGM